MADEPYVIVPKALPRMPVPVDDAIAFDSPQQVRSFFQKEMEIWDFLYHHAPPVPHRAEVRSGVDHMSTYRRMIDYCNELIHDPDSEDAQNNLRCSLDDRFGAEPAWPTFTSRDDFGKLLLAINDMYGPEAAAFGAEYFYNDTTVAATPNLACLSALSLLGDPALLSASLAARQLSDCKDDISKLIKQSHLTLHQIERQKDLYAAHIQSQAAVEYWNAKATEHDGKRSNRLSAIVVYFVLLIAAMIAFYSYFFYVFSANGAKIPPTLYGILFAGGASVIAALVWVGRFIIKLYISEHQMREDASERVVMTKTYLALLEQGAVKSDADRTVMLTSLFRPSPALISDDGPPDIGIGSALGKIISK